MVAAVYDAKRPPWKFGLLFCLRAGACERVTDLRYEAADGKSVSLNDFLPSGYALYRFPHARVFGQMRSCAFYGEFGVVREARGRMFSNDLDPLFGRTVPFFEVPEAFFSLLHEFGHAYIRVSESRVARWRSRRWHARAQTRPVKRGERDCYISVVLKEERRAWAFALKILRRLRNEGVDLIPELDTLNKLLFVIHWQLYTYELGAREDLLLRDAQNLLLRALQVGDGRELRRQAIRPRHEKSKR